MRKSLALAQAMVMNPFQSWVLSPIVETDQILGGMIPAGATIIILCERAFGRFSKSSKEFDWSFEFQPVLNQRRGKGVERSPVHIIQKNDPDAARN
jgi:hypothetical protein